MKTVKFSIEAVRELNKSLKTNEKSLNGAKRRLYSFLAQSEQSGFNLFVHDVLENGKSEAVYAFLRKNTKNSKTGAYSAYTLLLTINSNALLLAEKMGYNVEEIEQLKKQILVNNEAAKQARKEAKVIKNAINIIAA